MAMMSAAELLDWLGNNQFLPSAQVDALRPLLPAFADSQALAQDLIGRNWLSPDQVNQIPQDQGALPIVGGQRSVASEAPVVQAVPLVAPIELDTPPLAHAIAAEAAADHDLFGAPTHGMPLACRLPVAEPRSSANRKWLLIGGGATGLGLVVIAMIVLVRGTDSNGQGSRRNGPSAALQIMPVAPLRIREGNKTPVIVQIQRKDFTGPVKVFFEKLPDGFQSAEITIGERQDQNQLYLMVSFGSGTEKADLRLVAVAENLRDSIVLPVTIDVPQKPTPKGQVDDDD